MRSFGTRGRTAGSDRVVRRSTFVRTLVLAAAFALLLAGQAFAGTLVVNLAGTGKGKVTSADSFINCSNIPGEEASACSHEYTGFVPATLTATSGSGSVFAGWTSTGQNPGTCTGGATTNPCTTGNLFITAPTITATFNIPVEPPLVEIDSLAETEIGPTGATFHGTVNPKGSKLDDCRFEYLTQAKYQADGNSFKNATRLSCDPDAQQVGEGEAPVPVEAVAEGLEPNTAYRVRLVAEKAGVAPVSAEAPVFTTDGLAPTVGSVEAIANPTFASLYAQINPNNDATTYRFEWGPTDAYGSSVPVPDGALSKGFGDRTVVALVERLAPQTTYHFRVVAVNGAGTTESPDRIFNTPAQPPARGYELVTSVPKNGADAMASPLVTDTHQGFINSGLVSAGAVAWTDRGAAPNPAPTNGIYNWYIAQRDPAAGWAVRSLAPPGAAGNVEVEVRAATLDLRTAVLSVRKFDVAEGGGGPQKLLLREADGGFSTIVEDVKPQQPRPDAVQLSPDGSHVVFHTNVRILAGDTHDAGAHQVYEWTKAGGLRLAGVDSDGGQLGPCGALLAGMGGSFSGFSRPDVSTDGSRLLIQSPDPSMEKGSEPPQCKFGGPSGNTYVSDLYLREGDTTTNISKPPPGVPDWGARMVGATTDLSRVFFVTESALPDDDPATPEKVTEGAGHADLYRYDTASGELTRISVAEPGGEEDAGLTAITGPDLSRSAIVSADGSTVYFIALGRLVPGEGKGPAENTSNKTANLYRWSQGEGIRFIATVAGGNNGTTQAKRTEGAGSPIESKEADVTPDGSVLVFTTTTRLTPYDTGGAAMIYRYDAKADTIDCVSCSPAGTPLLLGNGRSPIFHTAFGEGAELRTGGTLLAQLGGLSADGATVVFASSDPLLPAVSNTSTEPTNIVFNIYAWHDGALQLISTGASPSSDFLLGTSPNGEDIYFLTAQRLLPRDRDDGYDIYDARVGGGFPEPAPHSICLGDECRGLHAGPAAPPGAGSQIFTGPGDVRPRQGARACPKKRVRRGRRCVAKRSRGPRACRMAKRRCGNRRLTAAARWDRAAHRHAAGRDLGGEK